MEEQARRRRRVRHPVEGESLPAAGSATAVEPTRALDPAGASGFDTGTPYAVVPDLVDPVLVAPGPDDDVAAERGLRGLVGGGSSQVRPPAALRARDAARPREEDLARAETELQIVRRHWTPRD